MWDLKADEWFAHPSQVGRIAISWLKGWNHQRLRDFRTFKASWNTMDMKAEKCPTLM